MTADHTDQYPALPDDEQLAAVLRARWVNLTPHVVRLLARTPEGGFRFLVDLPPGSDSRPGGDAPRRARRGGPRSHRGRLQLPPSQ